MEAIFHDLVSFTTSFDTWTVLLLLFWCFIGEIGIVVPYVLESFWLLIGFNLGNGALNPGYFFVLWIAAVTGRMAGSLALYRIACFGMPWLEKLFHKVHLDKVFARIKSKSNAAGKINLVSPFTVAFGRMFAMRVPMVMVCAAKRKWTTLAAGVVISSLIWDTLYVSLGAIFGATIDINQGYLLLISLGTIGLIYLITHLVKKLYRRIRPVRRPVTTAIGFPMPVSVPVETEE